MEGDAPLRLAAMNLESLAFPTLFLCLTAVAWPRLRAPYGVFALVGLELPLSFPTPSAPLLFLPRFGLVLFPLFLALATLGGRPRVHAGTVATSSILLGIAVARWATYQWVA